MSIVDLTASGGSHACTVFSLVPGRPHNLLIATTKLHNITIRGWNSIENTSTVVSEYTCIDKIDRIEFSPDGTLIMCVLFSRTAVQLFSIPNSPVSGTSDVDVWKCRINEGIAGMVNAIWSPCSTFVITESDFGIHLCCWALFESVPSATSKPSVGDKIAKKATGIVDMAAPSTSVYVINNPKSSAQCGSTLHSCGALYSFSNPKPHSNGDTEAETEPFLFAVVHRIDLQDYIALYGQGEGSSLQELCKFRSRSSDVALLRWSSPEVGPLLLAADSPLSYRLAVYTATGDCLAYLEAYQHALGLRCLGSGRGIGVSLLAAGSFDGVVRLLSLSSGQLAFELPLDGTDGKGVSGVSCWEEQSRLSVQADGAPLFMKRKIKTLPKLTGLAQSAGGLPAAGVSWLAWSGSGRFLAAREEDRPRCLWIWQPLGKATQEEDVDENEGSLLAALFLLSEPLQSASWRPPLPLSEAEPDDLLAFCTSADGLFIWSSLISKDRGAVRLSLNSPLPAPASLHWAGGGNLLVRGKDSFILVSSAALSKALFAPQRQSADSFKSSELS